MTNVDEKRCEVCGLQATTLVTDDVEVFPSVDEAGVLWADYGVGPTHWFCDKHKREATCTQSKEAVVITALYHRLVSLEVLVESLKKSGREEDGMPTERSRHQIAR